MEDGRWKMEDVNGRWKMGDGRWKMGEGLPRMGGTGDKLRLTELLNNLSR